ncbi:hypothetical protein Syun_022562 [Stephania yunnanensis]|uniref:Uncharacterized protein n=1 Tax=Stephania yunnanensis TaxID=152371 RepID=A0AAP0F783_9MAGN
MRRRQAAARGPTSGRGGSARQRLANAKSGTSRRRTVAPVRWNGGQWCEQRRGAEADGEWRSARGWQRTSGGGKEEGEREQRRRAEDGEHQRRRRGVGRAGSAPAAAPAERGSGDARQRRRRGAAATRDSDARRYSRGDAGGGMAARCRNNRSSGT